MIPVEAVEAAIKGFNEYVQDHSTPSYGYVFNDCLTAALESAAPYMLAGAWQQGRNSGQMDPYDRYQATNPYRSE